MFEPSKCPSASTETSVRSKKKKKQKNSKKKVRRRTERRRQQQRRGKFQRASLMFFSYARINCRFPIDKPIEQQSLQKHNHSAFLCICRFGDWNFNYTATLATKTFRLLPPWRVLLKRFFEPWLASATSQLDRNAWQRVATYKSGSKQIWCRIFFVWIRGRWKKKLHQQPQKKFLWLLVQFFFSTPPLWIHIEKAQTDRTPAHAASTLLSSYSQVFLAFFLQVQIPCDILTKFQCNVSGSSRRIASVVPVQHCCLEEDPSRPTILFPWAALFVVDSLSLILVGHSKGKTHETMKRKQVHHTSTSNDFHAALFVDEYPRPSIDVCTIGNSPTLHTNLSNPHLSFQLWVSKLSKSCQHFLNLLVKEKKQLWQVNVLSPRMPLCGTLSLFRTSFAGCYAFPCVLLGCGVSTCKPYKTSFQRSA